MARQSLDRSGHKSMIFKYANNPVADDTPIRPALMVPAWIILGVAGAMLGWGAAFGAWYGMTHPPGAFYLLFTDRVFLINGVFQSSALAAFLFYLHRQGWKPADFRIRMGILTTLSGLGLLAVTYGGLYALAQFSQLVIRLLAPTPDGWIASLFLSRHVPIPEGSIHITWIVLIVFMALNAFYEEIVYMGYGFNLWAAKYGPRTAVLLSILARLVVHTYQGTEHILPIALWAVIFGLWYRYHRAVWPLILAHTMIDLISMGLLKIMYGSH
jgi:membrane protease YdiL (CAAX protease family)